MVTRVSVLTTVFCITLVGQSFCYASPGRGKNKDKEAKLAAKIERTKNPGKRARLRVRLARLKLMSAIAAYDDHDFERGLVLLQEYRRQIDLSWKTLEDTRRGVAKHFRAYQTLEIALREDERMLEDLRMRVPYPESESVERIAEESSKVHRRVLGVIFPPGQPPQKSKKPRRLGGVLAATSAVET